VTIEGRTVRVHPKVFALGDSREGKRECGRNRLQIEDSAVNETQKRATMERDSLKLRRRNLLEIVLKKTLLLSISPRDGKGRSPPREQKNLAHRAVAEKPHEHKGDDTVASNLIMKSITSRSVDGKGRRKSFTRGKGYVRGETS